MFFGALRPIEVEHLYERSWFAVTETCLAMTLFRDQFDVTYLVFFGFLLVIKIFHWLIMDRVDFMGQATNPPTWSFHIKMWTIMTLMILIDVGIVAYAGEHTGRKGPSMMLIFGFENAIMAFSVLLGMMKYILHTIDLRSEHPWDRKSMWVFYAELIIDLLKLITYLCFFAIILTYYGFPLHILRDLYMILRSFLQRCKDLLQYHRATRNMNTQYPDATPADLAATDAVCIICRDEMIAAETIRADPGATPAQRENVAKKLPGCGHIFHLNCLRSWLERQQSCPTCRRSVLEPVVVAPVAVAPAGVVEAGQPDATIQALQQLLQQHQQHMGEMLQQQQQQQMGSSTPVLNPSTIPSSSADPVPPVSRDVGGVNGNAASVVEVGSAGLQPVATSSGAPYSQQPMYSFTLTPLSGTQLPPPPSLTNHTPLEPLTDNQLRALEGSTRERIIARLQEIERIQADLGGLSVRLGQVVALMGDQEVGVEVEGKGKERAVDGE
ncbi:E3 ubiquitin-protein ligase hrd1 [Podochytrium sp. JEL0797]|nr:E3 ubiquitin-protein ligase hrd1 [Podochytrium sp. JEL0797]